MKISKLKFYLSKLKNILLINKDFYNQFFFPSATLERDKFIKNWILNLPKKSKLLDAGAGIQRYKRFASHLEYTSQDFGEYTGGEEFGSEKVNIWHSKNCDIISDITNIPCENNTFDFILCSEVFEHLIDPENALRELKRILKSGGQILITTPFRSLYHQSPHFYYSGFSKYWFKQEAKKLNLEIINIVQNGNFIMDLAREVIRTTYFGPFIFRYFIRLITLPYLLILYFYDKCLVNKVPESCTGYFVILKK